MSTSYAINNNYTNDNIDWDVSTNKVWVGSNTNYGTIGMSSSTTFVPNTHWGSTQWADPALLNETSIALLAERVAWQTGCEPKLALEVIRALIAGYAYSMTSLSAELILDLMDSAVTEVRRHLDPKSIRRPRTIIIHEED